MTFLRHLRDQARAAKSGGVEDTLGMAAICVVMAVLFGAEGLF